MGQSSSNQDLFLKITQGQTQSNQLFDFQNGGLQQQQRIIATLCYLVSKGQNLQCLVRQSQVQIQQDKSPENALYQIMPIDFKQVTIKQLDEKSDKLLWQVIQPGQAYPLELGEVVKIGKIKIQLKKLVHKKEDDLLDKETVKQQQIDCHINDIQSIKSGQSNCDRCRICFGIQNSKNDPLICLCNCLGSIKYTHFNCLKDWIANSVSKRQDQHCKFYSYQEFTCQLCKFSLPKTFEHLQKHYSLIDFTTFESPYAQFQYSETQNNKTKYYKYIINLSPNKEVVIGRNNSSQVVMKDISISRIHCSLEYRQGLLLLRDKRSKFGTLVKLTRKQIEFNPENGLKLQYESKIIELYQKNTFKSCCCATNDNFKLIFQKSNKSQTIQLFKKQIQVGAADILYSDVEQHRENVIFFNQSENQLLQDLLPRNNSNRATMIRQISEQDLIRY